MHPTPPSKPVSGMFALLLGLGLVDTADRPTSRGRGRPDGGAWRVPNRNGSSVAARASMGAMGFRGRFSLPFRQVLRGHRLIGRLSHSGPA